MKYLFLLAATTIAVASAIDTTRDEQFGSSLQFVLSEGLEDGLGIQDDLHEYRNNDKVDDDLVDQESTYLILNSQLAKKDLFSIDSAITFLKKWAAYRVIESLVTREKPRYYSKFLAYDHFLRGFDSEEVQYQSFQRRLSTDGNSTNITTKLSSPPVIEEAPTESPISLPEPTPTSDPTSSTTSDPIPIELNPKLPTPTKLSETKLFSIDGKSHDNFGNRIASNGQIIAVATKSDRSGGKVYLFTQKPLPPALPPVPPSPGKLVWTETSQLKSLGDISDGFGESIAIGPDFLVVGAPYDSNNAGAVYIFPKNNANIFDYYFHYTVLRQPNSGTFGYDVALFDQTLVIGAPNSLTVGVPGFVFDLPFRWRRDVDNSGSAFVYSFDASSLTYD